MNKILVVRNDKIGDFMLAWPSFAMLKLSLPHCHIAALVPPYTAALARLCPWIDDVIIDCGKKGTKTDKDELISKLRSEHFDAAIALFTNTYNATLLYQAHIPYRLAPATKWSQFFYNHRLTQRRSRSEKPEYQYNLDLIRYFLNKHQVSVIEPSTPYLALSPKVLQMQKAKLVAQLGINPNRKWCFLHSGTGGSANSLLLEQQVELVQIILASEPFEIVLTAGPGEVEQAKRLQALLKSENIASVVYDKNDGLDDFASSIACADLFTAGSTGPLHIAAAADVPTIGFFPSKRSSTPLRWKTLNTDRRHLAFSPPPVKGQEMDMSRIQLSDTEVKTKLNTWLASILS